MDEGGGRGGREEEGLVIISLNLVYYFVCIIKIFAFSGLAHRAFSRPEGQAGSL